MLDESLHAATIFDNKQFHQLCAATEDLYQDGLVWRASFHLRGKSATRRGKSLTLDDTIVRDMGRFSGVLARVLEVF